MELKRIASWLLPHGVMVWRSNTFAQSLAKERDRLIASLPEAAHGRAYSHEDAIAFLASTGLDEEQVRAGSVPKASLDFVISQVADARWSGPVVGLQVGAFVGISLAHFVNAILRIHAESRMISVDPAIPHRGITHPDRAVVSLLNAFGLQRSVLLVAGYSLEKSISNDGLAFKSYDPVSGHKNEASAEGALETLSLVGPGRVDFAFIDGNHDSDYVKREVNALLPLLHEGSLLFLDDVTAVWHGMGDVFEGLSRQGFERTGYDGRVGALRRR